MLLNCSQLVVTPDLSNRLVPLDYYTWVKSTNSGAAITEPALPRFSPSAAPMIAPINPMAFSQYDTLLDNFTLEYARHYSLSRSYTRHAKELSELMEFASTDWVCGQCLSFYTSPEGLFLHFFQRGQASNRGDARNAASCNNHHLWVPHGLIVYAIAFQIGEAEFGVLRCFLFTILDRSSRHLSRKRTGPTSPLCARSFLNLRS